MTEPAEPGILDRLRARFGWFDHVMRRRADIRPARAISSPPVSRISRFRAVSVGDGRFCCGRTRLVALPRLLAEIETLIKSTVSGNFGDQLINLMDAAIASRTPLASSAWPPRHGPGWAGWPTCVRR